MTKRNLTPATGPEPPARLKEASRKIWRKLVVAIDNDAGLIVLAAACEAYDSMVAAQAVVDKHGVCVTDKFGQLKTNPATTVVRDSRAAFMRGLKQLDLVFEDPPEPPNPWAALRRTRGMPEKG